MYDSLKAAFEAAFDHATKLLVSGYSVGVELHRDTVIVKKINRTLAGADRLPFRFPKGEPQYINLCGSEVVLNDGTFYPSDGVASVAMRHTFFGDGGVCRTCYGEISGLPKPQFNAVYIVPELVRIAAEAQGRTDCVTPAFLHPDCKRDALGRIVSVPGFVRS